MILIPIILVLNQPGMIQPPMHRGWSVISGDSTSVLAVRNGVIYYSSQRTAAAISVETGKALWTKQFASWLRPAGIGKKEMFVESNESRKRFLIALDLANGNARTVSSLPESAENITCDQQNCYFYDGLVVKAIDQTSGRVAWRTSLSPTTKLEFDLKCLIVGHGVVFAGFEGLGFHALDALTGKVLWKEMASRSVYNPPVLLDRGVLTKHNGLRLQNYLTGKPVWSSSFKHFDSAAISGDVLIGMADNALTGVDLNTGNQIWKNAPLGDRHQIRVSDDFLFPADSIGALITEKTSTNEGEIGTLKRISKGGIVVWSVPTFFTGTPIYADSTYMITYDHERLFCYVAGASPALPTDESARKQLAQKLVADYELLDKSDIEDVVALAPFSTSGLIDKFVSWAIESRENGPADKMGRGQLLYGLLMETGQVLERMCTVSDTEAMVRGLNAIGPTNSYRGRLMQVLAQRGSPDRVIPIFIQELKATKKDDRSSDALNAVSQSNHPQAVQFMIDALNNPKAPDEWRHKAFLRLPGTGGDAGVTAVLKVRGQRIARPTFQSKMVTLFEKRDVLSTKKDAKGRTWRLTRSQILGNGSDVFLQRQAGSKWEMPIFLGFYTERTWGANAPQTFRGVPIAKLLSTEWIKIFPDDPLIRKDADKDGLSDLVEDRYGTNKARADTDGDGLKDAVDPCPTVAPRPLGDREKIIAACLEARFFAQDWSVPGAIDVDGVKPFEMYGYPGVLIWSTSDYKGKLPSMYGAGINSIGFHGTREDIMSRMEKTDWVEISADGKRAKTTIRRYSGGLNGDGQNVDLIKIGDDWYVTEMRVQYVS